MNLAQCNLPLCEPPRPNPERDAHIEEVENQRPAENDSIECPRSFFGQPDFGDDDCPRKNPEEVGSESLIEVPAGTGGEEDGRELVLQGVEDVAPVYVLGGVLIGTGTEVVVADLPHFLGYQCDVGGVGEVVCEGFHAP